MYRPRAFQEDRPEILHQAIRAHPLATLVTYGSDGLTANLLPFSLTTDASGTDILRAHLAKANGQLRDLHSGAEALVIFQGPQAYISPSWYATKREHGKVVPTWNYVVVQVRGKPQVVENAGWLRDQIDELTKVHEEASSAPWSVADAPPPFIASQLKGIAGIEIPIDRIEGKWKASQNQPAENRIGVVQGLLQQDPLSRMAAVIKGLESD